MCVIPKLRRFALFAQPYIVAGFRVIGSLVLLSLAGCYDERVPSKPSSPNVPHVYPKEEPSTPSLGDESSTLSSAVSQDRLNRLRREAEQSIDLGFRQYKQQRYEDALKVYDQALKIAAGVGDPILTADIHFRIGRTQEKQQNYAGALAAYQRAHELIEKSGAPADRAMLHNTMGTMHQKLGQIDLGRQQYEKAADLRRELADTVGEAKALANLASTYLDQGRYVKALELYQRARAQLDSIQPSPPRETGAILTHIGSLYGELGQYEKALEYHREALRVYEDAGDLSGQAAAHHNIGYTRAEQRDYAAAIPAFEKALAIREKQGDRFGQAETLNSLGFTWNEIGESDKAIEALDKALKVFQDLGDLRLAAATLDSLGSVYKSLAKYPEALDYYHRSLVLWRRVDDRDGARTTLGNIGSVLELQNQIELAIVFYKLSINITETIRNELKALPKSEQRAYVGRIQQFYRSLADLLLRQDRVVESQQVLDLLKIQEAADYLGPVRGNDRTAEGVPSFPPEQEIQKRYEDIQSRAVEIALELSELRRIEKAKRTTEQESRIRELDAAEKRVRREYMMFMERPDIKALVDRLRRESASGAPDVALLTGLRDNLERLGRDAVILYPLVLDDRLELVLVTAVTSPIHRAVPVKREELNRTVRAFREALRMQDDEVMKHARTLYGWVLAPIEPELRRLRIKTILYAPDGTLRYVPLSALHDGQIWIAQRFLVDNLTAISVTELETEPAAEPKILTGAFANGRYEIEIGGEKYRLLGLPFAGREVATLTSLFAGTTTFVDQAFSTAAIEPELGEHSIVHFATHAALVASQPGQSFILFGNGDRVTVEQIKYEWSLTNIDLVVLSACETALPAQLGGGEEILGFGFLMESKGARATIASLWKVDDGGTQALMTAFYSALKQPGVTKAEALRRAQVALITGDYTTVAGSNRGVAVATRIRENTPEAVFRQLNHPYYWAPFILIGNGL